MSFYPREHFLDVFISNWERAVIWLLRDLQMKGFYSFL